MVLSRVDLVAKVILGRGLALGIPLARAFTPTGSY
jgi:hypothetical protein